jgi:CRISPR-associated exonuclease Cas4
VYHIPERDSGSAFVKYNRVGFPFSLQGICLTDNKESIAISDIVYCHACAMKYYFERNEPRTESDRYTICKQVSYHLGMPLDAEAIWQEVLAVHPAIDGEQRTFLDSCVTKCQAAEWKPSVQTDVMVVSKKHGIVGMVDRMCTDGTFSIIRASGAMPFGTYASDRLRIACVALCLEEMTGSEVKGGNVEYILDGVSRFHTVQPRDRRQLLSTLHTVHSIHAGDVPHHPLNAPCNRCRHKERCESSGHRLSELL